MRKAEHAPSRTRVSGVHAPKQHALTLVPQLEKVMMPLMRCFILFVTDSTIPLIHFSLPLHTHNNVLQS